MKITIINGTNRNENKTINISKTMQKVALDKGLEASLVTLENFTELFRGDTVTMESATKEQKIDLQNIIDAKLLIFVVPTYHHGMPSSLKNFFDLVSIPGMFAHNVIGVISANKKGWDGARHTIDVINGYMAYYKNPSGYVIPDVPIIDYDNPDLERLEIFMNRLLEFSETK